MKVERQIRFDQSDFDAYMASKPGSTPSEVFAEMIVEFSEVRSETLSVPKPRIHRTTVTLTDEQDAALAKIAEKNGMSIDAAAKAMLRIKVSELESSND